MMALSWFSSTSISTCVLIASDDSTKSFLILTIPASDQILQLAKINQRRTRVLTSFVPGFVSWSSMIVRQQRWSMQQDQKVSTNSYLAVKLANWRCIVTSLKRHGDLMLSSISVLQFARKRLLVVTLRPFNFWEEPFLAPLKV